jgi:hypothetical protein
MNAQSSRSHSIFTLSFTQRKWVGSGPPPGAGAGNAPSSPTSRFSAGRPASPFGASKRQSALPTAAGRPATPSERPGSRIALRPGSVLGGRTSPAFREEDESGSPSKGSDTGEWVTITSKFHFVDLAGSERVRILVCFSMTR